jgi:hypothetical protein
MARRLVPVVGRLTERNVPLLVRPRRKEPDNRADRRREMDDWWGVILTVGVLACGAALVLYVLLEWAAGM